jgi:hypothetical protein
VIIISCNSENYVTKKVKTRCEIYASPVMLEQPKAFPHDLLEIIEKNDESTINVKTLFKKTAYFEI